MLKVRHSLLSKLLQSRLKIEEFEKRCPETLILNNINFLVSEKAYAIICS